MKELANNYKVAYRSPNPEKDFAYSPAILVLKNGRYIMSLDISDKCGKIYISDDKGETWQLKREELFAHASLFLDGERIYLLGCHALHEDLIIMYSDDNGETWSEKSFLTTREEWVHCATGVWYKDGYVYVPMETCFLRESETIRSQWKVNILAPVILRGKLGEDLTKRDNWLFSEKVRFRDVIGEEEIEGFGVPFFLTIDAAEEGEEFTSSIRAYQKQWIQESGNVKQNFRVHMLGWLESNVVQITDPTHYWFDPSGKTLHIFMRANTHNAGYCCVMKAVERVVDGKEIISIECEKAPSGKRMIFLPWPGGQNKFFVKYDKETNLYWLASVQVRDSMRRIEYLSEDRYGLASDERDRLALHFSKNLVDWCFAGLVAQSGHEKQSRHYASMDIDGDDLVILSRSGDENAKSAHDGNMITFHRIENFRKLVY